jgi:hypothetical protein
MNNIRDILETARGRPNKERKRWLEEKARRRQSKNERLSYQYTVKSDLIAWSKYISALSGRPGFRKDLNKMKRDYDNPNLIQDILGGKNDTRKNKKS